MAPVPVNRLAGRPVEGWRVRDGMLLVRTPQGEADLVCDCGRAHLLPTEEVGPHRLLLHCHACGRTCEMLLP